MEAKKQPDRTSRRTEPHDVVVPTRVLILCVALAAGCTPLSQHIAEEATPIAAEEAVETIAEPENAEAVARLMTDPAVKAAIRDVSQEATLGMLGLAGDRQAEVRRVSRDLVRAVSPSLAAGIGSDVSPALMEMVRRSTQAAFEEAFSHENVGRMRALGAETARDALRTASEEATNVLVPALVSSLVESIDDADIDLARIEHAVGRMSRIAAHEAVLGGNDGLRALADDGDRLVQASLARQLERTLGAIRWLAIALSVLLVVSAVSLAWLAYAVGRDRRARARRDEAVAAVSHLLRASEGRPWSAELRELLRDVSR